MVVVEEVSCVDCQNCKMVKKSSNPKNKTSKIRVKKIREIYCNDTRTKKEIIIYGRGYAKYEFGIARPEIYHKIIHYSDEGKRVSVERPNKNRLW